MFLEHVNGKSKFEQDSDFPSVETGDGTETFTQRVVQIKTPGSILFGVGASEHLPTYVKYFPEGPVLIVTDHGLVKAGVLDKVQGLLSTTGRDLRVFDAVEPDPNKKCLEECLDLVRTVKPKLVLGIGGGSCLDVAKVAAAIYVNGGQIEDYAGIDKLPSKGLPTILMPTTSGTGSEVSPNAVISDKEQQSKLGIVSPHLYCDLAIVDPSLTLSCPANITASSGMDALTHAIEIYTNRFSTAIVDTIALEAIRLVGRNLSTCVHNGADLEARSAMSLAALYAGLGLGPINTAAVHALAYPLGGTYDIPHGLANSILLPYVMEFNQPACLAKFGRIAKALASTGRNDKDNIFQPVEMVRKLSRDVGIPQRLRDINIPKEAIPQMAAAAIKVNRLLKNNPRSITLSDIKQIYQHAY